MFVKAVREELGQGWGLGGGGGSMCMYNLCTVRNVFKKLVAVMCKNVLSARKTNAATDGADVTLIQHRYAVTAAILYRELIFSVRVEVFSLLFWLFLTFYYFFVDCMLYLCNLSLCLAFS